MHIYESAENYLEAILALGKQGPVRSIDIAQYLEFSKPSVSRAIGILKNGGYEFASVSDMVYTENYTIDHTGRQFLLK